MPHFIVTYGFGGQMRRTEIEAENGFAARKAVQRLWPGAKKLTSVIKPEETPDAAE